MQQQHPRQIIDGTAFIVDLRNRELRQSSQPSNIIPFDRLIPHSNHLGIFHDRVTKNAFDASTPIPATPDRIVYLKLPSYKQMDPVGFQECTSTLKQLPEKNQRYKSLTALPILPIHDTLFYVHLTGLRFIQVSNPSNAISFNDVQDNNNHCLVLYDTATKNAFKGTWGDFTSSPTVRPIRLPARDQLDHRTYLLLERRSHILDTAVEKSADLLRKIQKKTTTRPRKTNNQNGNGI